MATNAPASHWRMWELPPITVNGQTGSVLREEEPVGPAGQPLWRSKSVV